MRRVHRLRGQTFPIWVFGTLTTLCLLAFASNYGNMLYWQIRAQNAADAAVQGALSIQATHLNITIAALHAAAVEEYRIRYILNDIQEVLGSSGSPYQCQSPRDDSSVATNSCYVMYGYLVNNYLAAVNRYTADVTIVENADEPDQADDIAAIKAAVQSFQSACGTAKGGDCAFDYNVVSVEPRLVALEDVHSDGAGALVVGGGVPAPGGLSANLAPLQAEVVTCAHVPPLFGLVGASSWIPGPKFEAVGRAAATTAMADQDFLQLGSVDNPVMGSIPFQPSEFPESANNKAPVGLPSDPNDGLYRIDYGGNAGNAYGNCGNPDADTDGGQLAAGPPCSIAGVANGAGNPPGAIGPAPGGRYNPSMTVFTGWWTSVAEASFAGPYTPATCAGTP